MRIRLFSAIAIGTLLLAACSAGTVTNSSEEPEVQLEQSDVAPPHTDLSDVVDEVLPSLVNVRVTAASRDPFGNVQIGEGEGSGVIIDQSGFVVTNNHVVQGAVEVTVVLTDGRRLDGRVIGCVPERDIAVVKVDETGLEPISVGRSSALKLGDAVVALGFPLGLGETVTAGIISGEARTIEPQGGPRLEGLLQTDAAINPGNSGGPLIDLNGNLVGINTAAASGAENVGFAIAIDGAIPIIEEIINEDPGERAWLGVGIQASIDSSATASQLGLDADVRGVLIQAFPDEPADEAGIESGEVIVALGGEEITSAEDLTRTLREFAPGDQVDVRLLGPQGSRTVQVTLGERAVCPTVEG